MSRSSSLAILLSLLAVLLSAWIGANVFQNLPHIEDEMAYVWQAEAISGAGTLKLASPPCHTCFLVPFVVDYQGERFGKYPPGWPVVLAAGVRLGARDWVNPLLAGLGVWLTYRLGKKLLGAGVGLLAAGLTLTSPFFMMNSASLLSHPLGLVLSLAFALAWLDTFWPGEDSNQEQRAWYRRKAPVWMTGLVAALSLGVLALTRPLTAVAVGLPFAVHGITLLWRGPAPVRRRVLLVGLVAFLVSMLYFLWQYALTGHALLNPYTLWWPYDSVGFGKAVGLPPDGNDLPHILTNLWVSLRTGASDFFGWGIFSWILLPFGVWAVRHSRRTWAPLTVFPSLVLVYTAYWIASWLLGPRYYYEGLYSITILTAAGILWVAGVSLKAIQAGALKLPFTRSVGWHKPDWAFIRRHLRPILTLAMVAFLVTASVVYYDPARILTLKGLYGVSQEAITAFTTSVQDASTPALVIVHDSSSWVGYGALLDLETPFLSTPYIFIIDNGSALNQLAIDAFPARTVINYYPAGR